MSDFLPFHVPDIGREEEDAVLDVMKSRWITTGPRVRDFEARFGSYVGASHAVAVNSATAALHLALDAVGLREGDEVILPSMTFAATAEVVIYFKANPVLVDCDPLLMNMDLEDVARKITPKTRVLLPVHFGGNPCEMDELLSLAKGKDLRVVEDAAHALPTSYRGKRIGTLSDITCFSFYATKTLTTGEGGMATTENPDYAEKMKIMSLHGISKDAWKRYSAQGSWYYEVIYPGFKYNLTDIAAAIGLEQLKKCDRFREERCGIAKAYTENLEDLEALELPVEASWGSTSWHLYVLKLNLDVLSIDRNRFIEELKERGIGTSVHFIPLHLHPYYRDAGGYTEVDFPVSSSLFRRIISLPIYPGMTDRDVRRVVEAVRDVATRFRR